MRQLRECPETFSTNKYNWWWVETPDIHLGRQRRSSTQSNFAHVRTQERKYQQLLFCLR